MKDHDNRRPYAPPEPAPPTPAGLFGDMRARVADAVEKERAEAATRGPLARALHTATLLAGLVAVAILFYGAYTFYDGPIRETPNGYAGKHGTPYPREHYELYQLWVKVVLGAFATVFATAFAATLASRRRK